ncbi:Uncharacterized protein FWK35_00029227, partial [Aphis craccivora]
NNYDYSKKEQRRVADVLLPLTLNAAVVYDCRTEPGRGGRCPTHTQTASVAVNDSSQRVPNARATSRRGFQYFLPPPYSPTKKNKFSYEDPRYALPRPSPHQNIPAP